MEKFTTPHRHRRPAAPQQRRHRPDHPGGLPQAGHPHRLRGRPVRGLAQRPGVRAQPAGVRRGLGARRRPRLRHRLVARARRVGAAELRLPGRASRRASATSSAATPARPGCSRPRSTRRSCSGCGTCSRPSPATTITVDLERADGPRRRRARTRSRTPSTSTTTRAGGCSRASTTSASRSSHEDDIATYEATRPSWKPATSADGLTGARNAARRLLQTFVADETGRTVDTTPKKRRRPAW